MSSLAFMRWLESAPARYDAGMRLLTFGRAERVHAAVAEAAARVPEPRILEIGSGTGSLTARLVERGARVTAVEQSPEMLDLARARLADAPADAITWLEQTASEIDQLEEGGFDAFVASFCLSEMSRLERSFVLREARRRLAPAGVLVVADEVRPRGAGQRLLHALLRLPQAALAWVIAGSVSRPLPDLPGELREAGFRVREERRWLMGGLGMLVAEPA